MHPENFWMQGGSIELGANVWRGWGIAADLTGVHTGSIGSSSLPLSLVTITFGPRYRWHSDRRLSLFGQGIIGEANGFGSLFPQRRVCSLTPTASPHNLAAASTTSFQIVSPSEYSMPGGRGPSFPTAPAACKMPFASVPAWCCASRTNRAEAQNQ
jgi:hypothetical protein